MTIYLTFLTSFHLVQFASVYDQWRLLKDDTKCKEAYANGLGRNALIQSLYSWDKVLESLSYNRAVFKYLAVRQLFAKLPFDFAIIYFQVPALMWYFFVA